MANDELFQGMGIIQRVNNWRDIPEALPDSTTVDVVLVSQHGPMSGRLRIVM